MNKNGMNIYENRIKRLTDILCGVLALVVFGWLYLIIALLVKIKLGSPIIYVANRAGKIDPNTGKEKEFRLYKFRTMTNEVNEKGELLPDIDRLTKFGRILRSTSLDELPEVFNIIKGDMSVIGPRPLPVIYLPYYTEEERKRHTVRPGLSGYAQVNGRNSLSWEEKFRLDLQYINNISCIQDVKIVFQTIVKAIKRSDIGQGEEAPGSLHILRGVSGNENDA